ncbi:hypothetical protein A4X13_0g7140 [Tilletia indica]|uniref:Uncharacterized protein n=1 Tax=Tilletia indica TaxID=43049 RepID=A0A177TKN3_9BASI|nr:hypothetical protein A4X13_0g7140 [Tilletia indica]
MSDSDLEFSDKEVFAPNARLQDARTSLADLLRPPPPALPLFQHGNHLPHRRPLPQVSGLRGHPNPPPPPRRAPALTPSASKYTSVLSTHLPSSFYTNSSAAVLQPVSHRTPSQPSSLSAKVPLRTSTATSPQPEPPRPIRTPPSTPAKRRRIVSPAVEAARAEAKSRNPLSLQGSTLAERDVALEGVASLIALNNFDIVAVQTDSRPVILSWRCRCCHSSYSQPTGVVCNLSKHSKHCHHRDQPKTPGFLPWTQSQTTARSRSPPNARDRTPDMAPGPIHAGTSQSAEVEEERPEPENAASSFEPAPVEEQHSSPENGPAGLDTLKTLDSKFSLFIQDHAISDKVTRLGLLAVWMDDTFQESVICLDVVSFDNKGRRADNIAATLIRLGIIHQWSGLVVARPSNTTLLVLSALRSVCTSDDRIPASERNRFKNIQHVTTLQSHLEGVLSSGGFGSLAVLCNRMRVAGKQDSDCPSPTPASGCPAPSDIRCPRLLDHRPGLLLEAWLLSAAVHANEPISSLSRHPTVRFLKVVDQTMSQIRAGLVADCDTSFVLEDWQTSVKAYPNISRTISDGESTVMVEAGLSSELAHLRRNLDNGGGVSRLTRLFRDPPSCPQTIQQEETVLTHILLRALDQFGDKSRQSARDKEIATFLSGVQRSEGDNVAATLRTTIDWWKTNAKSFPRLALVARCILSLPAGLTEAADRALREHQYK